MKMRPSRIYRWIVRIFLWLLTISLTVVSILGGYSAILILENQENFDIPSGPITTNFNITDPSSMYINVPFNLTNAGYFDLTNLIINIKISMTFRNNLTHETNKVKIFDKTQGFAPILRNQEYSGNFTGVASDFIEDNFPDVITEVDWSRTPALEFYANFTISAYYSLDLLAFTIGINNSTLGSFSL